MKEPCEYELMCDFADNDACKWQGNHQDCALWRDWSIRAKIARHNCNVVNLVNKAMGLDPYKQKREDELTEGK